MQRKFNLLPEPHWRGVACNAQELQAAPLQLYSPKSSGIPPSLRYSATFRACGHAVARRAKVVSGVAGEFCCLSLHRSQISEDL
jgi:hypothetical protein